MLSKLIIGAAVAASGAQMAAALPDYHGGINRDGGGGHGGHGGGGGHGGHGGGGGGHSHGGGGGGGGSGYNAPSNSYNAPSPSYNAPSPSYNAPSPSYNEPSYDAPSYNSPSSGYDEPSTSYDSPSSSYGSPSTGYGYDDGHGGGGLDLTSILIPLLALVGLSLLFPTYVSLTTVRRKREAGDDEEWDPAGRISNGLAKGIFSPSLSATAHRYTAPLH